MRLYDAHNHLQDERLAPFVVEVVADATTSGLVAMVVNGACPQDWEEVLALSRRFPCCLPSFGVHPWYLDSITPGWQDELVRLLRAAPSGVGEVGVDGYREGIDQALEERVFLDQVSIATQEDRPLSIHGLRAWGRLYSLLKSSKLPSSGFLLHSYGGPKEMVSQFADLGAFFSFPGYFLGAGRENKLEVFRSIPHDRILVETDAPDQPLPAQLERVSLPLAGDGKRINSPANVAAVYAGLASAVRVPIDQLAKQVERNFLALFRKLFPETAAA